MNTFLRTGESAELVSLQDTLSCYILCGHNLTFTFVSVRLQVRQGETVTLSIHSKPCCSASSVYHKRRQGTGHLKLAAHAGQGAELCQRPLPDGRRHPQPASPAQTQRSLHPDRGGQGPAGGEGLPRAVYRHRYGATQSHANLL